MTDTQTGFTTEERAAMRERARELKAASRRGGKKTAQDGEADVRAAIAAMPDADRAIAERVHAIVTRAAPALAPRTWYGMPAYALDGNVVCYLQNASKFKARFSTLGFSDKAKLDDGETFWPVAYALTELSPATEARIVELVKKAVG